LRVIRIGAAAILGFFIFVWTLLDIAAADDCRKLRNNLGKLREDYRRMGQQGSTDPSSVTFEDLTAVLDKIVEVRRSMRKLDCDSHTKKKRDFD